MGTCLIFLRRKSDLVKEAMHTFATILSCQTISEPVKINYIGQVSQEKTDLIKSTIARFYAFGIERRPSLSLKFAGKTNAGKGFCAIPA